jgi:tetratricopeptide (TPR) repeat protein
MSSSNALAYDAIRVFRDAVFDRIREAAKKSSGSKYLAELRDTIGKDRWDDSLRSARQLRAARVITQPLIDDLDAQDVSDLPRLIEKKYDQIVDVKGQRKELLAAVEAIAFARNGIAHPAATTIPVEDARRIAGNISTAAKIIFGEPTEAYRKVAELTTQLFAYSPPAVRPLPKSLPPRQEIIGNFVGRESELRTLYEWLASPLQLWILEGDGGKGKSSIAFVFCESLATAGNVIDRVIWLTAKNKKYQDGQVRALSPDFTDLASAFKALIAAFGFEDACPAGLDEREALSIDLLKSFPALIVLDDVDSLDAQNENVAYWFTNILARVAPGCKVLLTTRRALYGLGAYTSKIEGLNYDETKRFLRHVSERHFNDADILGSGTIPRLMYRATDGSPLYLEDLVRLTLIVGKPAQEVVSEWASIRHDVREYALRREFEMLGKLSQEVLLAIALADEPISRAELLATLGGSESALEGAISELQRFFLISPPDIASLTPMFEINRNLGILVKYVMANSPSVKKIANALTQVRNKSGKPHRVAKDASRAIREAVALVARDRHTDAENILRKYLSEKYPEEGALLSHLGWVLIRWPGGRRITEAQSILQRAVDVRHRNKATYENLGALYIEGRLFKKARMALEVGLEMFPDNLNLRLMHSRAAAESALEVASNVDVASAAGAQTIMEPLQEALRIVISAKKQLPGNDSGIYTAHRDELEGLDVRLRTAIDEVRRRGF